MPPRAAGGPVGSFRPLTPLEIRSHMIRVAMLSFWHVHAGDYLRQATNNPSTEVVAVWDEDPDRGRAKAAEIGVDFVERPRHAPRP